MVSPYDELAAEILGQPSVMQELTDWFNSDKPRSVAELGSALGKLDSDERLSSCISLWISNGQCKSFVGGYLFGLAGRLGSLPKQWIEQIDEASRHYPEYGASLTLQVDVSRDGVNRVLSLIASRSVPFSYLNGFATPVWRSVLQDSEKARILDAGMTLQGDALQDLFNLGLALVVFWTSHGTVPLTEPLIEPGLKLLRGGITIQYLDQHDWAILLNLLRVTHPNEVVDIALQVIATPRSSSVALSDSIAKALISVAQSQPSMIMDAVGRLLLDDDKGDYFSIFHFRGLFETIGLAILTRQVSILAKLLPTLQLIDLTALWMVIS